MTTFDGDTRPDFVEAVQDGSLANLRLVAEIRRQRVPISALELLKLSRNLSRKKVYARNQNPSGMSHQTHVFKTAAGPARGSGFC
jgi:hypothetical protein